ncbi:MAG TPA: sigma-70 family RNA polymerase sigma factor, partial [Anseongella sp.]|nr:sigma-70 family RNA polymerase sigma factor [Anseongella sp.]
LFTTLWTRRAELDIKGCLSAYLYVCIRNRVIKLISRKQVESAYFTSLGLFLEQGSPIADHLVREKELARTIEREIGELPPKMRTIFNLSRKEHLSHGEIADRLGLSAATVKKQVNNALKVLRVKLQHFLLF